MSRYKKGGCSHLSWAHHQWLVLSHGLMVSKNRQWLVNSDLSKVWAPGGRPAKTLTKMVRTETSPKFDWLIHVDALFFLGPGDQVCCQVPQPKPTNRSPLPSRFDWKMLNLNTKGALQLRVTLQDLNHPFSVSEKTEATEQVLSNIYHLSNQHLSTIFPIYVQTNIPRIPRY